MDIPQTILVPRIAKITNGALQPKFYTGGVMGEDTDVLRKMDIGQLDGCGCTTLGVVTASPEASVFMAPDLFNNYEEIDYVYEKLRKRLDKSFEQKGYICGGIIDSGFLYVFSKKEILSLDELKQHKTITCMGEVESTLLKELGVNAVPVAMPEVISALSSGMADTFIAPPAWALGMQAYQYVKYYIKTPFFYSPGVVLLSANTRSKIQNHFGVSEAAAFNTQELIVLELMAVEPEWKKRGRIYEEKSLEAFEAKCGIQPVILSPQDQKTFAEAARSVRDKLAGKAYPRDLLDDVSKTLEQYRKTHPAETVR
jgi:TRAP-type C4-dicarboxylate transport system substrate-binding protein